MYGDHCLVCSGGGDRTTRHNRIRNAFHRLCGIAGLNPELDRSGILRPRPLQGALGEDGSDTSRDSSARRPADVYVPRWRAGKPAAFDFAVTSGLRTEQLATSAQDGSAAALQYEGHKCEFLNTRDACAQEGVTFIPMVVEASGG